MLIETGRRLHGLESKTRFAVTEREPLERCRGPSSKEARLDIGCAGRERCEQVCGASSDHAR
jgi:hypothetical protein